MRLRFLEYSCSLTAEGYSALLQAIPPHLVPTREFTTKRIFLKATYRCYMNIGFHNRSLQKKLVLVVKCSAERWTLETIR